MAHGSQRPPAPYRHGVPKRLDEWLNELEGVIDGLGALRHLGHDAHDAIEAVLEVRAIRTLRLGWELWESLVESDGEDPEALLLTHLALTRLESVRWALWGTVPTSNRFTVIR